MSGLDADGWQEGVRAAELQLIRAGLDLVRWFSVRESNRSLPPEYRLPEVGSVGLIVGNTRAIWEPFRSSQGEHAECAHPLDTYVERHVKEAVAHLSPSWLRFGHDSDPAPIPIQRYAASSGLAQMSPVGLSLHPQYGPWIALRAVALFDVQTPRFGLGRLATEAATRPCDACARPCLAPFQEAMAAPNRVARRFLPVRLSCPVGTEFQYTDEQIDFHYGRGAEERL